MWNIRIASLNNDSHLSALSLSLMKLVRRIVGYVISSGAG